MSENLGIVSIVWIAVEAVEAKLFAGVITTVASGFLNEEDLSLVSENLGIVSLVWIGIEAVVETLKRHGMVAVIKKKK